MPVPAADGPGPARPGKPGDGVGGERGAGKAGDGVERERGAGEAGDGVEGERGAGEAGDGVGGERGVGEYRGFVYGLLEWPCEIGPESLRARPGI
jgi:hypothetical protein